MIVIKFEKKLIHGNSAYSAAARESNILYCVDMNVSINHVNIKALYFKTTYYSVSFFLYICVSFYPISKHGYFGVNSRILFSPTTVPPWHNTNQFSFGD